MFTLETEADPILECRLTIISILIRVPPYWMTVYTVMVNHQQNEQSPVILTHWTQKMTMTYDVGNIYINVYAN